MVGAATLRTGARCARSAALAASLWLLGSAALACTTPEELLTVDCAAAARLRAALDSGDTAAHIDAWGRSVPEVWYDLARLDRADQARLVMILERTDRGPAAWSDGQRAMYLVLVSLMRESRLFVGIVRSISAR